MQSPSQRVIRNRVSVEQYAEVLGPWQRWTDGALEWGAAVERGRSGKEGEQDNLWEVGPLPQTRGPPTSTAPTADSWKLSGKSALCTFLVRHCPRQMMTANCFWVVAPQPPGGGAQATKWLSHPLISSAAYVFANNTCGTRLLPYDRSLGYFTIKKTPSLGNHIQK